jgi:large subunit ribosomal protein L9
MEVMFLQDVPRLAHAGEVRKVANGYARNYLIPQGLAVVATREMLKRSQKIKAAGDERRARETQVVEELAQILDNTSVTVSARVTPTGRYYGAIGSSQVAEVLGATLGREIDRKLVEDMEPIREPGQYQVVLHLSSDIQATINVTAETEA